MKTILQWAMNLEWRGKMPQDTVGWANRVVVVRGTDSGAFVFNDIKAAKRFVQVSLGLDENWDHEDVAAGPVCGFEQKMINPQFSPTQPIKKCYTLTDSTGDKKEIFFDEYIVISEEGAADAWQALQY